nr:hypothetical protein GCM10020093_067040 [Planobispora longispora]
MADRQVGVLDGAHADRVRDLGARGVVVLAFGDHGGGADVGLVEQLQQLDRLTAPGLEHLAVAAQHAADLDVLGADVLGQPARHPGGGEQHRHVQGLGGADHVDDAVGLEVLDPVADRGHVGGGVAVPAVTLTDHERERLVLPAGEAGREDAERAVADHGDAAFLEFVADLGSAALYMLSPAMSSSVRVTPSRV